MSTYCTESRLSLAIGVLAALVLWATAASAQNVLAVPSGYPTIQSAINAAVTGDTVLVGPGTYPEHIDFLGKTIAVESTDGAQATIIDANLTGTAVQIVANPGQSPVLRGFTIRRGYGFAGGITAYGGPALIENNLVTGNFGCPGGISASFSEAIIRNNVISNNRPNCSGGPGGGGILVVGAGAARVLNNVITGNIASSDGGGISLFAAGSPAISGNVISNNASGGGAGGAGGGIVLFNASNALIANNVITGNSSFWGGGIYWLVPSGQSGPNVVNNTIAYNNAVLGTGVFADGFDIAARLTNNILVGSGPHWVLECGSFNDFNPPVITSNDVFNADASSGYGGTCADQTGVNGNIAVDPLFVSAAAGDFHIQSISPAIDAGSNAGAPPSDIDGNRRPVDGNGDGVATVDLGADEVVPPDTTPPVISVPDTVYEDATSPAGAVVTYSVGAVDDIDPTPTITCIPASGSIFPQLLTTVTCTAIDAVGNTAFKSFDVVVKDANWQLLDIKTLIGSLDLGKLGTSLQDKIEAARRFVASGKPNQARDTLSSFINQVNAQIGKTLTVDQAAELVARAMRIQNVLAS